MGCTIEFFVIVEGVGNLIFGDGLQGGCVCIDLSLLTLKKVIVLQDKLDAFKDKLDRDFVMEIHIAATKAETKAAENKELKDDLMHTLRENRLAPYAKPCTHGTRTAVLQEIEHEIMDVDGPNLI